MKQEEARQRERANAEAQARWNATFGETVRHNQATEGRPAAATIDPYDREAATLQARADFLDANPEHRGLLPNRSVTGTAAKPTALQANVRFLESLGYSTEDALSIVQRMIPTESEGSIYDALRGVVLPTKNTRTPKVPQRNIGPQPSHEAANPLSKFIKKGQ